jgi:2-phospho-L-lactate guanylyltransferase
MMSETWALVPLKTLDRTKLRLAPALSEELRRTLVLAMAQDVLSALEASESIENILLVSSEHEAGRMLKGHKLDVFYSDRDEGINRELELAAAYARARGADRALIVHGDLPLLNAQSIEKFMQDLPQTSTRAAGCKNGSGINLLLTPLPLGMKLKFGRNSLQSFINEAGARELPLETVMDERMGMDIDSPEDLRMLMEQRDNVPLPGLATQAFLSSCAVPRFRYGSPHAADQTRHVERQENLDA